MFLLARIPLTSHSYGVHPIYMEHRFNSTTSTSQSHGVFLLKYVFDYIPVRTLLTRF
jgi:hypothetical protein